MLKSLSKDEVITVLILFPISWFTIKGITMYLDFPNYTILKILEMLLMSIIFFIVPFIYVKTIGYCILKLLSKNKQKLNVMEKEEFEKQQFLEKYGDEKVEFSDIFKLRVTYKNEKLKIWCSGVLDYNDIFVKVETVNSISELDHFQFGTLIEIVE